MTTPTPNSAPPVSPSVAAQGGTATPPANGGQSGDQGGSGFNPDAPTISQNHMNHLLAEQKREFREKYGDYDDVRDKAERYDALIGTAKSAEEQAADLNARLATRDRDVSERELTIQRYKLAGDASLPADLWDMIGGTDETSIKSNIEKLKRHMAPETPTPPEQQQQPRGGPRPTPGQGNPPPSGKGGGTMEAGRELFQSRLKRSGANKQNTSA